MTTFLIIGHTVILQSASQKPATTLLLYQSHLTALPPLAQHGSRTDLALLSLQLWIFTGVTPYLSVNQLGKHPWLRRYELGAFGLLQLVKSTF